MVMNLTANDVNFVLNAGTDTAVLRYKTPGGETKQVTLVISNAAQGEVTRTWTTGDLPDVGSYLGQVQVTRTGDSTFPRTFPNDGTKVIWFVNYEI